MISSSTDGAGTSFSQMSSRHSSDHMVCVFFRVTRCTVVLQKLSVQNETLKPWPSFSPLRSLSPSLYKKCDLRLFVLIAVLRLMMSVPICDRPQSIRLQVYARFCVVGCTTMSCRSTTSSPRYGTVPPPPNRPDLTS